MATKLRNIPYNLGVKFLLIILGIVPILASIWLVGIISEAPSVMEYDSYYDTYNFHHNISRLTHNVVEKKVMETIGDEETEVQDEPNTYSDTYKYDQSRMNQINTNLSKATGFLYVLENLETGSIETNISEDDPIGYIMKQEFKSSYLGTWNDSLDGEEMNTSWDFSTITYIYNGDSVLNMMTFLKKEYGQSYGLYIGLKDDIPSDDSFFYADYSNFEKASKYDEISWVAFSLSALYMLFLMIYLILYSGKKDADGEVHLCKYDEIPHEIQTGISSLLFMPILMYMQTAYRDSIDMVPLILFIIIPYFGLIIQYTSLIRLFKTGKFFKNLIIIRVPMYFISLIRMPKLSRGYHLRYSIMVILWVFTNFILIVLLCSAGGFFMFLLLLFVNGLVMYRLFTMLRDLKIIIDNVHGKRNGQATEKIQVEQLIPALREFGDDVESLKDGLDVALEERIKGEKMKTELITNVTHDLKNPLTSIISYVELIKAKDAYDDEMKDYIGVLDEKSGRLKILIEQLVDASKASSGNLDINKQTVDIVQLSRQICGEYEEKITDAELSYVITGIEHPCLVNTDPVIIHRILDNLFMNVSKYSMKGSRVYIDLNCEDDKVRYSIKNISSDPLNMPIEDLTRRFVRGDVSRNTEGSGLGLSIALSLSRLVGADLNLEIDGDLFKATLTLKKSEELPVIPSED